jgi:uncharacterized RDD family membrane protein YckC
MRCGAPLQQSVGGAAAAPTSWVEPASYAGGSSLAFAPEYAGFWLRFFAALIDGIIVGIVSMVIFIPVGIVLGIAGVASAGSGGEDAIEMLEGPLMMLNWVVSISLQWLYEALLTSSSKQATLGKLALGMVVTDLEGNRISFGRATGRHFGKYVSSIILLIGYLMQPFTAKRQALHDILAGTLVVKKPA